MRSQRGVVVAGQFFTQLQGDVGAYVTYAAAGTGIYDYWARPGVRLRSCVVSPIGTTAARATVAQMSPNVAEVRTFDAAGTPVALNHILTMVVDAP